MIFKSKTNFLSIRDGTQKWVKYGHYRTVLDRINGPAQINKQGDMFWFKNGEPTHIIWHDVKYETNK